MVQARDYPQSFGEALRTAAHILSTRHDLIAKDLVETEAEQIVAAAWRHVTGEKLTRVELFSRLKDRISREAGERILIMAGARAEGKILQHLIGYQQFLDHEYKVGPEVLVPRPETELLVTHAIEELEKLESPPRLGLEIGLGSGVIAVELLNRFPDLQMVASEFSGLAEETARANAHRILGEGASGEGRLKIARATDPEDVWQPFSGLRQADFVISNPPYLVDENEVDPEVYQNEPHMALFAPDGNPLHFYREIARGARGFLKSGGIAFVEIAHERAIEISRLFITEGWKIRGIRDLAGRERILVARHG